MGRQIYLTNSDFLRSCADAHDETRCLTPKNDRRRLGQRGDGQASPAEPADSRNRRRWSGNPPPFGVHAFPVVADEVARFEADVVVGGSFEGQAEFGLRQDQWSAL